MDGIDRAAPIIAYPILSDKAGSNAHDRYTESIGELHDMIGFGDKDNKDQGLPVDENLARHIMEKEIGRPMIDIEDIINNIE